MSLTGNFREGGVPRIRYADDMVLLVKSERAAKRLLESSAKYSHELLLLLPTMKMQGRKNLSGSPKADAISNCF